MGNTGGVQELHTEVSSYKSVGGTLPSSPADTFQGQVSQEDQGCHLQDAVTPSFDSRSKSKNKLSDVVSYVSR